MPKPNPLTRGVNSSVTVLPAKTAAKPLNRSRKGRVLIGGHFAPEVQTALKIIAAEERTTMQALLTEGINTLFAKRRKPEIAEFSVLDKGK
jgi:hypothetical protein